MRKIWMTAAFVGLLCQSLSMVMAAEPTVYYKENFRNYREVVPTGNAAVGIQLGNDPIWSQTAEANFRMTRAGLVFNEFLPTAETAPDVRSYDVLFEFRFQTDNERKFDLRLRHGQANHAQAGEVIVTLASDRVRLSSDGVNPAVDTETKLDTEIPNGQWHQCAVTMRDGNIKVFIDENRVLEQVVEADLPSQPTGGINFYGYKDSGFSLTNIAVREPAPLPDHAITDRLPAPLDEDEAAYRSGTEQPHVVVPANDRFGATFRTGLGEDAVRMAVDWASGESREITFDVAPASASSEETELPDAIIQVSGIDGVRGANQYHIRPKLRRYHTSYSFTETYHDIVRDWELLPRASEYPVKVECRRTEAGVDLYLNGRFAGSLEGGAVESLTFTLAPNASLKDVVSVASDDPSMQYLPLDIAALKRAKAFVDAEASLPPGMARVNDIPMRVASGEGSADLGLTRQGQGNWALEVDEYLARSAFDGLLTEVHFSVPSAPYTRAWVLAAVDPDPAKDPILTTRLTHYVENGIGSNRIADTTTTLPRGDETPGEGITQVGTVSITNEDDQQVEVPLYLIEVPLRTGEVIDLVMNNDALNFEFFGKPWENYEQIDKTSKPDPRSTSAVQIFGVTLEKAPVGLEFVQSQPGNVFHNAETRETDVVVEALSPAEGELMWEIFDVDGERVDTGAEPFRLAAAGDEQAINIPLDMPELGWYELLISVRNDAGETLMTHPARFALLGENRRQAGYESPYGIWWFDGAHNTPSELEFAGPIMFKAGIRLAAWTGHSEEAMSEWMLTKRQVNMPFSFSDLDNPEAAKEKAKEAMEAHLEKYPHLREVLVYHESGPGNSVPVELIGGEPELSEAQLTREKRYADLYNLAGAFFEEHYPELDLVVGNNSSSQQVMAAIFRHGGNPKYIDYVGQESPSQVYIPEKLQEWGIQGHHLAMDTVKMLAGRDVGVTQSYEGTYRSERDMGEQQQAEWYMRDALIGLAHGYTRIGPGILFDASNAYYNGLWGGSGIMQRGPWGYPKKAYVAYATLTNILDQVTLRRQVPTGSTTVYALAFDRADGKIVSALWAARGEAEFIMTYERDTTVQVIDMYGRRSEQQTVDGKVTVKAGTSPAYVVADQPVESITLGERTFPKDMARAAHATVVAPLDDIEAVTIDDDDSLDTPQVAPLQLPVRQRSRFQVRQVTDEQKGAAIELELDTSYNPDISKYITEYTTLRLDEPAPISGEPAALGVWVKGNSNWGRVMFEIRDAEGETWRSIGTSGWGCDILDWPGNISVNFDGWNFVALALEDTELFNDHSPGPVLEQWVSSGGDKQIDYPIEVTALIVETNRTALDLVDFKPVDPVIRLKDISGIAAPD